MIAQFSVVDLKFSFKSPLSFGRGLVKDFRKNPTLNINTGSTTHLNMPGWVTANTECPVEVRLRAPVRRTSRSITVKFPVVIRPDASSQYTPGCSFNVSCRKITDNVTSLLHPAGRALNSYWSANSLQWLSLEIFFKVQPEFLVQSTTKKISHRQPL